jgi:hypothetical protein
VTALLRRRIAGWVLSANRGNISSAQLAAFFRFISLLLLPRGAIVGRPAFAIVTRKQLKAEDKMAVQLRTVVINALQKYTENFI